MIKGELILMFSVAVFVSSPGEFAAANTDGAEPHGPKPGINRENNVVRLKGLPYECTREDVALFFQGNITSNSPY